MAPISFGFLLAALPLFGGFNWEAVFGGLASFWGACCSEQPKANTAMRGRHRGRALRVFIISPGNEELRGRPSSSSRVIE